MPTEDLQLTRPCERYRESYLDYVRELEIAGEPNRHLAPKPGDDFATFLARLSRHERGEDLPAGYVPYSIFWLVRGDRVIGTCSFRHELTDSLRNLGGHIGYGVRPGERGRGYATKMLALALEEVRAYGLRRVLITCDKTNYASARVIQKNGGLLDSEGVNPTTGVATQRYWIELPRDVHDHPAPAVRKVAANC